MEVLTPENTSSRDTDKPTKDHWLRDELYRDVENEKIRLQQAIREYEKTTAGSSLKAEIDLKTLTTWDDVCNEVDQARERYKDAKGIFGKIRKGFSKLGKHEDAVKNWLQLLPSSNDYLSILCGGLKLIVSAAGRLRDIDDTTVMALTEIPSLLLSTEEAVGIFGASDSLRGCAADLYVSVLACINQMVVYFSQKAQKQLFHVLFKAGTYQDQIPDSIRAMEVHANRFAKAAQGCHYRTSMNTNTEVRALHVEFDTWKLEQKKYFEAIYAGFLAAHSDIDPYTRDLRPPLLSMRKAASSEDMFVLKERARSRNALLEALDIEDSTTAEDISTNLRTAWASSKDVQSRIMAMIQDVKLHLWIVAPHSTALFVNGHCSATLRRSPVSYVSAKLAESVGPQTSKNSRTPLEVISLSFFCGEHTHRKDPDSGPDGMMRNLIAQLLLNYDNFELITVRKIKAFDYEDIEDLCDVFEMLIAQLPPSVVVFCIVDSVGVFEEDKSQRKDARVVMETLVSFAEGEEEACTFKLLATSSWNSTTLYKAFPDQKDGVLWMPLKVASQGTLTASKLEAGIGKDALRLSPARD